jgi:hypothetical protein
MGIVVFRFDGVDGCVVIMMLVMLLSVGGASIERDTGKLPQQHQRHAPS